MVASKEEEVSLHSDEQLDPDETYLNVSARLWNISKGDTHPTLLLSAGAEDWQLHLIYTILHYRL